MKNLIVILMLLTFPTLAQTPGASNSSEMRKLDFLTGEWEGDRK